MRKKEVIRRATAKFESYERIIAGLEKTQAEAKKARDCWADLTRKAEREVREMRSYQALPAARLANLRDHATKMAQHNAKRAESPTGKAIDPRSYHLGQHAAWQGVVEIIEGTRHYA